MTQNVTVFLLFRRDLVDLTASCYFTRIAKSRQTGGVLGHFQFKVAKMSDDERQELKSEIDQMQVPLNPFLFYAQMLWRIRQAYRNYRFGRLMLRYGLPVEILHYEDFNQDSDSFIRSICDKLGVPFEQTNAGDIEFKKLSRKKAISRIRRGHLVANNILTRLLKSVYKQLAEARF